MTEQENKKGSLILLPNLLGDLPNHTSFIPQGVEEAVKQLDGLIAESEKGGRRFLGRFETKKPAHNVPLALLNEHTQKDEIDFLLEPIQKGEHWGLVSDCGLPCIADPGALLIKRAKQLGLQIEAYPGPSSIFLALMLSGFSGQRFTFHGYLSKDTSERIKQIKAMEQSALQKYTQIFMETSYRNQQLLQELFQTLSPDTWLCLAMDLTLPTQRVLSFPVSTWTKSPLPKLEKKENLIFLVARE